MPTSRENSTTKVVRTARQTATPRACSRCTPYRGCSESTTLFDPLRSETPAAAEMGDVQARGRTVNVQLRSFTNAHSSPMPITMLGSANGRIAA